MNKSPSLQASRKPPQAAVSHSPRLSPLAERSGLVLVQPPEPILRHFDAYLRTASQPARSVIRRWLAWCSINQVAVEAPRPADAQSWLSSFPARHSVKARYVQYLCGLYAYLSATSVVHTNVWSAPLQKPGHSSKQLLTLAASPATRNGQRDALLLLLLAETGLSVPKVVSLPLNCLRSDGERHHIVCDNGQSVSVSDEVVAAVAGFKVATPLTAPHLLSLTVQGARMVVRRVSGGMSLKELRQAEAA